RLNNHSTLRRSCQNRRGRRWRRDRSRRSRRCSGSRDGIVLLLRFCFDTPPNRISSRLNTVLLYGRLRLELLHACFGKQRTVRFPDSNCQRLGSPSLENLFVELHLPALREIDVVGQLLLSELERLARRIC